MANSKRELTSQTHSPKWRAIEFFAGIGGFACACPEVDIALAIDIDEQARRVYQMNWPHAYKLMEISSMESEAIEQLQANLWWMSPPCQPYSRRGHQKDEADARAGGLLRLIALLEGLHEATRPAAIALENVVGFEGSQSHARLCGALDRCGYHVACKQICPTELGWPNLRPRYYLLATQAGPIRWRAFAPPSCLPSCLMSSPIKPTLQSIIAGIEFDARACAVEAALVEQFGSGMHRVDLNDRDATAACFGSSYGKSLIRAGSYVIKPDEEWRRFAPLEVARILGFPATFRLPDDLSYRRAWKLLGNSLSIPAVRYVMAHLIA